MGKKLSLILLAVLCSLSLSACWDHVEISELLIVSGIGLDVDETGSVYHAAIEIINVEGGGDGNIASTLVEANGPTIPAAIQNAMLMTGGNMFSNHCKSIIVGDELARKGINEVVDMILRNPDFRKTVDILVAKDTTATSILKGKTVNSDVVSYELSKILRSNEESIENTVSTTVYQLHEILMTDNAYFVIPAVYTMENNGEDVLQVEGCAVFVDESLTGYIDGSQSKLLNMITGGAQDMTITIENASLASKPVDVKIIESKIHLTPGFFEDALFLRLSIRAKATLEDAVLSDTDLTNIQSTEEIQVIINEHLSSRVRDLAQNVQTQFESDIFEFYREFEDHYRLEWPDLKQNWKSYFRDMEIAVDSDVRIIGSGLISSYKANPDDPDSGNALP